MYRKIFSRGRAALLALVLALAGTSAAIVATPGPAAAAPLPTRCTTLYVTHIYWQALGSIQAAEYVPICYTGISVWMNGNITAEANGIGWSIDKGWVGSYHDSSQRWIGVGENFTARFVSVGSSIDFTPRWYINQYGQNYAYSTY
jgi:hypothetical protein